MKIIRVFPRKIKRFTPVDDMVRFGPPGLFDECDEVHISVLFTWDIEYAEELAEQWKHVAPVKIGGPAYGKPSGIFNPGIYVKKGAVITSRGCPNKCWFCSVWKREPKLIELSITEGTNVLDDNLLACSESHIRAVFSMLKKQKGRKEFTGGFEAKLLKDWHIDLLIDLSPAQIFFAFDTPDDEEPLRIASNMLHEAGFNRQKLRCYCLIGYECDTFKQAEKRLNTCVNLGFFPMAMLWRNNFIDNKEKQRLLLWREFTREWSRPAIIYRKLLGKR